LSNHADIDFEIRQIGEIPEDKEDEELSDDEKKEREKKRAHLKQLKEKLEVLDPMIYDFLIDLSVKFKGQIDDYCSAQKVKYQGVEDHEAFIDDAEVFLQVFDNPNSILKQLRICTQICNFRNVETTWLDEIAEALKNIMVTCD
jgi:hypothetical protein